jgi:fused signal recognition particle receptor
VSRHDVLEIEPERQFPEEEPKKGFFGKLKRGLFMTHTEIIEKVNAAMEGRTTLDEDTLEFLEEALIGADLGVEASLELVDNLRKDVRPNQAMDVFKLRERLVDEMAILLLDAPQPARPTPGVPRITLVVGVNGVGKTTSIAKLARRAQSRGEKVVIAAGDTFRAAAIEQLKIWGQRTGAHVVARETGADAAGLAFDALRDAREAGADVLLVDTAGRLQNKDELMAELEKVIRVVRKIDPAAPHSVLLTLDATTGQNAMSQVEIFGKRAGVTGLVMTKLDGTARGGILVAIAAKFGLPVHFIGVGEGIDDLEPFAAEDFAKALAGLS